MAGEGRPDALSVIAFSGGFDRVHYALVLASAAAAIGTRTTVFFTMAATRALLRTDHDDGSGWRAMPPGEAPGTDGGAVNDAFAARGVATFEELLAACVAMGVRFLVCEMGLRAMGLTRADLRDDVPLEEGGVVTMLNDASATGSMVFV